LTPLQLSPQPSIKKQCCARQAPPLHLFLISLLSLYYLTLPHYIISSVACYFTFLPLVFSRFLALSLSCSLSYLFLSLSSSLSASFSHSFTPLFLSFPLFDLGKLEGIDGMGGDGPTIMVVKKIGSADGGRPLASNRGKSLAFGTPETIKTNLDTL
jgi:hypothetical protein